MSNNFCLIDVGGGMYSQYPELLQRHKNLIIYCIEPHEDLYKKLQKFRGQLHVKDPERAFRFRLSKVIISDLPGMGLLYICNDPGASSTLPFVTENLRKWKYPIARRIFETIDEHHIQRQSLTDFVSENRIKKVILLNVDTQGDALGVLSSLGSWQYNNVSQIRVKVQSTSFELYKGQTRGIEVVKFLGNRYFDLASVKNYSRNQEEILTFNSKTAKRFLLSNTSK